MSAANFNNGRRSFPYLATFAIGTAALTGESCEKHSSAQRAIMFLWYDTTYALLVSCTGGLVGTNEAISDVDAAAAELSKLRVNIDASPSSFACPRTWARSQYPDCGEPAFSCFRPFVGPPYALPASLVSPVFGKFMDEAGASLASLGRCDMESTCLVRLLEIMPRYHKMEKSLQEEMNVVFSRLLGGQVTVFKPSVCESTSTTDGGLFVRVCGLDVLVALIEYKKDAFTGSGDPQFQMLREVQMFWEAPERERCNLHASDTCPVLLIEVAGPLMRVSAAATLLANRVQSEPLTPFLHILHVRDQPQYMGRLLATLRALRNAVSGLRAHYLARENELLKEVALDRHFRESRLILPYPLHSPGTFSNVEALCHGKLLYVATQPDGTQVCIKFSRHVYAYDVHKLWADAGLAPKLLQHSVLPGGLHQVVMEFLHPSHGWMMLSKVNKDPSVMEAAIAGLRRAHRLMLPNGQGTAHGDCRDVNVLVRQRSASSDSGDASLWEVRFVDFDGAGAAGQHVYPPLMSSSIIWPNGVLAGEVLLQSHDVQLLRKSWD